MAKVIHKYQLKLQDDQQIDTREGLEPLSVGLDPNREMCLWAVIDLDRPKTKRAVLIRATGQEFDNTEGDFIGTVVKGSYVWHVFMERP